MPQGSKIRVLRGVQFIADQEWVDRAHYWKLSTKTISGVPLGERDKDRITQYKKTYYEHDVPNATFSRLEQFDAGGPHYICLPSLMQDGPCVILKSVPIFGGWSFNWLGNGVIEELSSQKLTANMSKKEAGFYRSWMTDEESYGLALHDYPSFHRPSIEGKLLAVASRVFSFDKRTKFLTSNELEKALFKSEPEELFPHKYVIIPDLQAGYDSHFGFDKSLTEAVYQFLKHRLRRNRKTIVYVRDFQLLPDKLSLFLRHYYELKSVEEFPEFSIKFDPLLIGKTGL